MFPGMTARKFIRGMMPPFLFEGLRSIVRGRSDRYKPAWHTIKDGLLKGRQIFIDPRDGLWQKDMTDGSNDRFLFDWLGNLDLTGKTIFDIGAHVGYHTLHFASLVGVGGKVIAFEPNRYNRKRLEINLGENADLAERIKVSGLALSDRDGHEIFYFAKDVDKGMSSASFLGQAHTLHPKTDEYLASFKAGEIRTVCLDHIRSHLGEDFSPYLLKIDVEGAEAEVLEGGREMLRQQKPIILMEVHSVHAMFKTYDILRSVYYSIEFLHEALDGRCFVAAVPQTGKNSTALSPITGNRQTEI